MAQHVLKMSMFVYLQLLSVQPIYLKPLLQDITSEDQINLILMESMRYLRCMFRVCALSLVNILVCRNCDRIGLSYALIDMCVVLL